MALIFEFLLTCVFLSTASALTLPYMVTAKPRHTKYSSSTGAPGAAPALPAVSAPQVTPPPPPVTPSKGVSVYRAKDNKGTTCILLKTDALIEIKFKSHIGDETGDTYLPDNAKVEGNCKYEDEATLRISWPGYSIVLNFAKTPGGERWYVNNMELGVSTELPQYHNIRGHGAVFKLYHDKMALPTPVGKSYHCDETVIDLSPREGDVGPDGLSGTLFLRAFQVQPFMYKGANFGPSFECNAAASFRDETAPIAVGSTLAVAVLLTISGYGVFRYFKIKKVQYNTME